MKIHPMWQEFPTIQKDLNQTLTLMEKSIQINNKPVKQAIVDMIHSGGKLLRPAYQLLFAQFGPNQEAKKAVALAASIELLHTATLIHDDIIDMSELRRRLPTIQATFGNDVAVYAGDYLFICCFKLLAGYASSLKSIQLNSVSMEKVLIGELGQMNFRYDYSGGVAAYLDNITGKTAELFALSCFVGAYESGCSQKMANNARKIGLNIGIAFQIIDDILDYSQTSKKIGKPVLEDVKQGVYSLPLLLALENKKEELAPLLAKKENLSDAEAEEIFALVHAADGVKKAQALAEQYTKDALVAIEKLPDNSMNTKETLKKLTTKILWREN
ncbi:polyprenyl synthetase family protein [Enterococcus timonensis]|uniref:polyprenyl synthetase family protein n=1 Tax=Enterococcus timonensis TaxID=1852364 RepID=UPI0008D97E79|nr:polyprenyl synthetase family protein [Enterococcus timonensis]